MIFKSLKDFEVLWVSKLGLPPLVWYGYTTTHLTSIVSSFNWLMGLLGTYNLMCQFKFLHALVWISTQFDPLSVWCESGNVRVRPMNRVTVRPGSCGCRKSQKWNLRNVSINKKVFIINICWSIELSKTIETK